MKQLHDLAEHDFKPDWKKKKKEIFSLKQKIKCYVDSSFKPMALLPICLASNKNIWQNF